MVYQKVDFDDAVAVFGAYCRAKGLSDRTIQTYEFALGRLREWLQDRSYGPAIPQRQDLRLFVADMLERGLSRQTIRIRMRSIRVFANFLEREGITDISPMNGVEIPRVPASMPEVLSSYEIQKLLHATRSRSWYGIRNRGILGVFLDCGLRLGELVSLRVQDVDLPASSIHVRRGKRAKDRKTYMGRRLSRELRKWSDVRGFYGSCDPFFSTRDGRQLDKRNVARIIERIAARAKLGDRRVHPHLLRHTFATHFIKNGGDPFSLQRLLGHADIQTTMIYVNLAGADLEEAHAKASPLDRLSPSHS